MSFFTDLLFISLIKYEYKSRQLLLSFYRNNKFMSLLSVFRANKHSTSVVIQCFVGHYTNRRQQRVQLLARVIINQYTVCISRQLINYFINSYTLSRWNSAATFSNTHKFNLNRNQHVWNGWKLVIKQLKNPSHRVIQMMFRIWHWDPCWDISLYLVMTFSHDNTAIYVNKYTCYFKQTYPIKRAAARKDLKLSF